MRAVLADAVLLVLAVVAAAAAADDDDEVVVVAPAPLLRLPRTAVAPSVSDSLLVDSVTATLTRCGFGAAPCAGFGATDGFLGELPDQLDASPFSAAAGDFADEACLSTSSLAACSSFCTSRSPTVAAATSCSSGMASAGRPCSRSAFASRCFALIVALSCGRWSEVARANPTHVRSVAVPLQANSAFVQALW